MLHVSDIIPSYQKQRGTPYFSLFKKYYTVNYSTNASCWGRYISILYFPPLFMKYYTIYYCILSQLLKNTSEFSGSLIYARMAYLGVFCVMNYLGFLYINLFALKNKLFYENIPILRLFFKLIFDVY